LKAGGGEAVAHSARPPDVRAVALAQAIGRLDDRIEHRLKIEFRAADNLENFGGSCLLFKCDTEIRGARLTASKSRAFSNAIMAWSANVLARSICCCVNGSIAARVRRSIR